MKKQMNINIFRGFGALLDAVRHRWFCLGSLHARINQTVCLMFFCLHKTKVGNIPHHFLLFDSLPVSANSHFYTLLVKLFITCYRGGAEALCSPWKNAAHTHPAVISLNMFDLPPCQMCNFYAIICTCSSLLL